MTSRFRTVFRFVELSLLCFVAYCGIYFAANAVRARAARRQSDSFIADHFSPIAQNHLTLTRYALSAPGSSGAQVIGRLDIPALRISVPIMADYQSQSLRNGIGHIPGTALPGGLGTMGLAGHRDTYFRALKNVQRRMDIRVTDRSGSFHYLVDSTEIVQPEDVQVLDIQSQPELTLITCYPFSYIGAAPQRFIVHAHLVSASPDE